MPDTPGIYHPLTANRDWSIVKPLTVKSGQLKILGSTAKFGKKSQTGFLPQFKVWKTKEYCMYFSFFKLKKWGKKTAETRRRNCAVVP